jgi:hypothetical protein
MTDWNPPQMDGRSTSWSLSSSQNNNTAVSSGIRSTAGFWTLYNSNLGANVQIANVVPGGSNPSFAATTIYNTGPETYAAIFTKVSSTTVDFWYLASIGVGPLSTTDDDGGSMYEGPAASGTVGYWNAPENTYLTTVYQPTGIINTNS